MLKSNWSQIQAGPFNLNQWKMKFSANSIKTDQVEVSLESCEIQEQHDYIYPLARKLFLTPCLGSQEVCLASTLHLSDMLYVWIFRAADQYNIMSTLQIKTLAVPALALGPSGASNKKKHVKKSDGNTPLGTNLPSHHAKPEAGLLHDLSDFLQRNQEAKADRMQMMG